MRNVVKSFKKLAFMMNNVIQGNYNAFEIAEYMIISAYLLEKPLVTSTNNNRPDN